jgi:hypothetical protein
VALRHTAKRGKRNFNDVRICAFSKNTDEISPGFDRITLPQMTSRDLGDSLIASPLEPERFPETSRLARGNEGTNDEAALALRVLPKARGLALKANEKRGIAEVLKPVAPVSEPPAESENGESGADSPPEGQEKISDQTEGAEGHPENLALHAGLKKILTPRAAPRK